MQKNWYAVYTKPNCEKRVSGLLTKKGITNFYPLNRRKTQSFIRSRVFIEPLFKSYVFVRATESEIISISSQTHYILSLLYWMGKPATINDSEIEAIRDFTQNHSEIEMEKIQFDSKQQEESPDRIAYTRDGKLLLIKNRVTKVHLPSLGYTLTAKTEDERILSGDLHLGELELAAKS